MAEATLNIYQKLAKIRKQVEVIRKNKAGYGYKYVTDDEILAKLTGLMEKYGISLIPNITPQTLEVVPYTYHKLKSKKGKDGATETTDEIVNEIRVNADMTYIWINNDNPDERISVPWVLVGHQSDGSQAFGSALTYSFRYFLLKYFNTSTPEDDPDNWRSKQRETEEAEDRALSAPIIEELDKLVRGYLEEHSTQKDKDEIKSFINKYIKGGNYKAIAEPVLAGKLLTDFKGKYINKTSKKKTTEQ